MSLKTQAASPPSAVSAALAKDRLGVPLVIGHALSGSAPMTVVAAGMTVGFFITGNPGLPLVYLVVAAALGLFSVGYVAMSRHIVNAGSFYTYITHGLGRPVGVGAAFVAKVGYNAMQVGLYGGFGVLAANYADQRLGLDLAWWAWALGAWLVIALFGVLRIDINGAVLGVVLACELVLIIVYDVVMATHPAGGTFDVSALSPAHLGTPSFGAAAVTAIAGLVGYEATTVFSEEAKDPRTTIARATYLSLGLIAALYAFSALAMTMAAGPANIVTVATDQQAQLLFHLVSPHMNTAFIDAGNILACTSLFAAGLAFHNTCARYAFALGREEVLPHMLAATGLKTGAPKGGSLFQSAIGLIVIVWFAVAGFDPLVQLFFWLTTWAALGVLALMFLTSFAVISYFWNTRSGRAHHSEGVWRTITAPVLAAAALGYILMQTFTNYHNLLGVPEGHRAAWMFPTAMMALFGVGALWAAWLRWWRPDAYARIGLGAAASPINPPGTAHGGLHG